MNNPIKIVIIDNEEDFCYFVKMNLEETGEFKVETATSGREGISLVQRELPDLVLLDILMPEMSGAEVGEILINDPITQAIPIIFLTGMVDEKDMGVETIKQIGQNNFVSKTAGSQKIIESIKAVLKK